MNSAFGTVRALIGMLDRPLKRRWAGLVGLAACTAVLETFGTGVVFGVIGAVTDTSSLSRLPVVGATLAEMARQDRSGTVVLLLVLVAAFFVMKNAFIGFQIFYQERVAADTTSQIATRMLRGYLHAPYSFHFQRNASQSIQNLEFSVDVAFRVALLSAVIMTSEVLIALGLSAVLVISEPLIAMVTVVTLGGLALLTMRVTHRIFGDQGRRSRALGVQALQAVRQSFGAVKEIKILGREDFFADDYGTLFGRRARIQCNGSVIQQMPRLVMEALLVGGMVLIIAMVALGGGDHGAVAPTLGLFGYVGFRLQPSLNRLTQALNNIGKGAASTAALAKDLPLLEAAAAAPLSHPAPLPFERLLRVEDVRYTYPQGTHEVLKGISLDIPRGMALGVVGSTGAGKSTLIDVILGLLAPSQGRVLVDDADIAVDPRAWQRKIGYVPQAIYLLDDSLRKNIAFGLPDDEIEDALVWRAAEMAQLSSFIQTLPDGLDARVGERGINLSGGQRQRIAVARALYAEPELLIFDEATSALDAETERELTRAIDSLSGHKTIILIAHRLSTLKNCDRIVMLKDGVIAGLGSYAALVETNADFRKMVELSALGAGNVDARLSDI